MRRLMALCSTPLDACNRLEFPWCPEGRAHLRQEKRSGFVLWDPPLVQAPRRIAFCSESDPGRAELERTRRWWGRGVERAPWCKRLLRDCLQFCATQLTADCWRLYSHGNLPQVIQDATLLGCSLYMPSCSGKCICEPRRRGKSIAQCAKCWGPFEMASSANRLRRASPTQEFGGYTFAFSPLHRRTWKARPSTAPDCRWTSLPLVSRAPFPDVCDRNSHHGWGRRSLLAGLS